MSYNDRIRECAQWVRAHRGDTVEVPKDALAKRLTRAGRPDLATHYWKAAA